ncbi:SMI1/KNR4 family protein [Streptomyces sp. NPDC059468]|uniref:SMI1/KNR4 family protein n=1 Tax=Streptomyces sp. NPDC059468 TaxID=3346845 RepID=UPI0036A519BC
MIAATEERLGRRLPPSYRDFLAVSDGWHVDETAGVYQLGGAADIDWFRDPYDMTPLYEQNLGDNPRDEDVLLAGMWQRALRLETDSAMSSALLDPGDSDQNGEWALYMQARYRGFHCDRAQVPSEPSPHGPGPVRHARARGSPTPASCGTGTERGRARPRRWKAGRPPLAGPVARVRAAGGRGRRCRHVRSWC